MHEVQLKIKIIKNLKIQKSKNLITVCVLLTVSSGRVETKQKQNGNIPQHINCISPPPHRKLCSGREPRPDHWG